MQITLYQRYFSVKDSPTAVSFLPYPPSQKHTLTIGQKVHEAAFRVLKIIVPDDAKIDQLKNMLSWKGSKGSMKCTATEVLGFAQTQATGFAIA